MALTSPLLIGEVPEDALSSVEAPLVAVEPMLEFAPEARSRSPSVSVLSLHWSLAAAQAQPLPQDQTIETAQESDGDEDQAEEPGEDDPNVIVVTGAYGPPAGDPIAAINEESYRITQQLDNVLVEPMAYAYRDGLPGPIRDGLGNFVQNLGEPNNALNFLLQGKFGKAFETLGRLLINTTLGLGGLIDIAEKPGIGLPYRRNGFGNTLGYYGVGGGPYLYLPITGATNARDLVGSGLDQLFLPTVIGAPFNQIEFTAPYFVISNLDSRLEFDAELARIDDTIDPYAARRDSYLYRRAKEIAELKGEEPPEPPAIMEEVDGTGDFADPPEVDEEEQFVPPIDQGGEPDESIAAPANPLIITKPD
ncbi:MAG: VacJ family lipoprotein [Pseudomonadota bacterium]